MATITEKLLKTLQKEVEKTTKIFPFSEKVEINFYPQYNNVFVVTIDDCEFTNKELDKAIEEAIDFFTLEHYKKWYAAEEEADLENITSDWHCSCAY